MKPRLLDLFCGAGGAAMGYHRAGFDVVGVDIRPQPNYPFEFVQYDALDWVGKPESVQAFDAIHASPPCQAFTSLSNRWRGKGSAADGHINLIPATRELLQATGTPYLIENVESARRELIDPVIVCGSSVGLEQSRHRLFECGGWSPLVPSCYCRGREFKGVYGQKADGRWLRRKRDGTRANFVASSIEEGRLLMDMPWAQEWRELTQAVPPAYTEMLGHQLMAHLANHAPERGPNPKGTEQSASSPQPQQLSSQRRAWRQTRQLRD